MKAGSRKALPKQRRGRRRRAVKCRGYIWTDPTGIRSNLLIDRGRVLFTQPRGTLTALDVATGAVLARKGNLGYSRRLKSVDRGILAETSRGVALLDRTSLDVLWQISDRRYGVASGGHMVCWDDDGLRTCLSLDTGQDLWSYHLSGGYCIAAEKGKALLFNSTVYDGAKGTSAVVLLDLETGKELLHRTTPPGIHYWPPYFDGEHIYLPCRSQGGESPPDTSCPDRGRPSAPFERMLVWDLTGREIESIPVPDELTKSILELAEGFVLAGKAFAGGRVWKHLEDEPGGYRPKGLVMALEDEDKSGKMQHYQPAEHDPGMLLLAMRDRRACSYRQETRFNLGDDCLIIANVIEYVRKDGRPPTQYVAVELRSSHGNWEGRLPHVRDAVTVVVSVAATERWLLLGTVFGHVEAIDRATGESLWMYICGDAQYRPPEAGLRLAGSSEPPHPAIIIDPEPYLRSPPSPFPAMRRIHPLVAAYYRIVEAVFCLTLALRRWISRK